MNGNSFGKIFKVSTYGESHGAAIGGTIDGCPAGLALDLEAIQYELDKRKPGQSKIVTQRKESDTVEILSGVFEGKTTGTPIGFIIRNEDQKSKDYSHIKDSFRPSHADYTYQAKHGFRDYRGGGRSSARETAARVVAGAVAKQVLAAIGVNVLAYVDRVQDIAIPSDANLDINQIESNDIRCPHAETADKMIALIKAVKKEGDTVGGTIKCVAEGVPAGWGEPVFDKLHASLGHAMLGINAVKGFEIGSGIAGTFLRGSAHNDIFETDAAGKIITKTNLSGGIQGGISNGMPIYFSVAFKPVATIMRDQNSVDNEGNATNVQGKGRHDPCVLPRAVPIVEAMANLVLVDFYLRNLGSKI